LLVIFQILNYWQTLKLVTKIYPEIDYIWKHVIHCFTFERIVGNTFEYQFKVIMNISIQCSYFFLNFIASLLRPTCQLFYVFILPIISYKLIHDLFFEFYTKISLQLNDFFKNIKNWFIKLHILHDLLIEPSWLLFLLFTILLMNPTKPILDFPLLEFLTPIELITLSAFDNATINRWIELWIVRIWNIILISQFTSNYNI